MQRINRGFGALLLACALLLASMLLSSTPAHADDVDDERAECLAQGRVWVLVQPEEHVVWTGCASQFRTGLEALTSAGFTIDNRASLDRINGYPSNPDGRHYWSYWHSSPDAGGHFPGYVYSQSGAGTFRPGPGSIQAWRYTSLDSSPSDAIPSMALPTPSTPTTHGDQDGNGQADVLAVDDSGALLQYGVHGRQLAAPFTIGQGWQAWTWISTVPGIGANGGTDLVGRRDDGTLWLLRGRGGGQYEPAHQIGQSWNTMSLMTVVSDITGDGLPELLARSGDGHLVRYSFASGTEQLRDAAQIGRHWSGIRLTTSVGDFGGDGVPDLLAVDATGSLLRYSFANGGIVAVHRVGRHWESMGLVTSPGDLDHDGRADLVALRTDGTLWAYPNERSGAFGRPWQLQVGLNNITQLA